MGAAIERNVHGGRGQKRCHEQHLPPAQHFMHCLKQLRVLVDLRCRFGADGIFKDFFKPISFVQTQLKMKKNEIREGVSNTYILFITNQGEQMRLKYCSVLKHGVRSLRKPEKNDREMVATNHAQ